MLIINLQRGDEKHLEQAAQLLWEGFKDNWPEAWPTLEDARTEVAECVSDERICRAALNETGDLVGWIGAMSMYNGNAWELHPIVVDARYRKQGIGTLLVRDLEEQVRLRNGLTIYLGSDDENAMTSLSDVDIYDNLWERIKNIQNFKGHPYEFYLKCGFQIVGVVPDANGLGKPDIIMAKRVVEWK